jgi:hypothetical protein
MARQDKNAASDRLSNAGMEQAEESMAQLSSEAASLSSKGKVDADLDNQRNELLWKITAQIDETKVTLEELTETEKRLKKHLGQLQQLKKIMAQ